MFLLQKRKSNKSVLITEEGKEYASALLKKYGISDWNA